MSDETPCAGILNIILRSSEHPHAALVATMLKKAKFPDLEYHTLEQIEQHI
jgi:hypothetical protein